MDYYRTWCSSLLWLYVLSRTDLDLRSNNILWTLWELWGVRFHCSYTLFQSDPVSGLLFLWPPPWWGTLTFVLMNLMFEVYRLHFSSITPTHASNCVSVRLYATSELRLYLDHLSPGIGPASLLRSSVFGEATVSAFHALVKVQDFFSFGPHSQETPNTPVRSKSTRHGSSVRR